MKYFFILFAFIFFLAHESCTNKSAPSGSNSMPACISKMTEGDKTSNLPVRVDEYEYKGQRVFLVTADCCDQYNTVFDENCTSICSPSGGLDGRGDRKCPDFDSTAKHIKKLWEKK